MIFIYSNILLTIINRIYILHELAVIS